MKKLSLLAVLALLGGAAAADECVVGGQTEMAWWPFRS